MTSQRGERGSAQDRELQGKRPDETQSGETGPGIGDAGQGPATTLSSGYSGHSSTGGTAGDVLKSRGSGYAPGAESRVGATPDETDPLAREGIAAGTAGMGDDPPADAPTARGLRRAAAGADTEDYDASEGGRAVGGVSGTSGGGSGTTPADNARR